MQQQPKNINKHFLNRVRTMGKERRLNMYERVLEGQPHFPKPVEYEDIDRAVFEWVDKQLEVTVDGEVIPTYKLFSNQRISEYGQDWEKLDDNGSIRLNFKTVTRENNPQKGDNQGNTFNIPGHRDYTLFKVPVLHDDGREIMQIYTMKQPYQVNFIYTISIITNVYSKLNEMNSKLQYEFSGLECYIHPNGYPMPMFLNSVSDDSDYTIDDRKYYAQSFQVKLSGYIINQEGFKIKEIPTIPKTRFVVGMNRKTQTVKAKYNIGLGPDDIKPTVEKETPYDEISNPVTGRTEITVEEYDGIQRCWLDTEDEITVTEKCLFTFDFGPCSPSGEVTSDSVWQIEEIRLDNVRSYKLYVNNIEYNAEEGDVIFRKDDIIKVEVISEKKLQASSVKILCFNPNTVVD